MRYNPAFLTETELIDSFVVRHAELRELSSWMSDIAQGATPGHVLVIGQRGSGKTTLLRRLAADVHRAPELDRVYETVVLHEELFEVADLSELWREVQFSRAAIDRSPQSHALDHLDRVREHFVTSGKRLFLGIENLYTLLDEQFAREETQKFRAMLALESKWLTVVATTTARRREIETSVGDAKSLFRVMDLQRLSSSDTQRLVTAITGQAMEASKTRPIEILTGGNPRLVGIMSTFATTRSLRELMQQLTHLIDEHTSYFKSNLESLPFYERRTFVALAELWTPASTADVSAVANIDVNRTSVYLNRLMSRGHVQVESGSGRSRKYQVAERLYNIYYLMRRSGHSAARVRALVDFMLAFYTPEETMASISHEACAMSPTEREPYYLVAETILGTASSVGGVASLLHAIEPAFIDLAPASFRQKHIEATALALQPHAKAETDSKRRQRGSRATNPASAARVASDLLQDPARRAEAITLLENASNISPSADVLLLLASAYLADKNADAALKTAATLTQVAPKMATAWLLVGSASESLRLSADAEAAYRKALDLAPTNWSIRYALALFLADNTTSHADSAAEFEAVVAMKPDAAEPYMSLASLYGENQNHAKAVDVLIQGERFSNDGEVSHALGHEYFELRRYRDAHDAFTRALNVRRTPHLLHMLGRTAMRLREYVSAERYLMEAIATSPNEPNFWLTLGQVLHKSKRLPEAADALSQAARLDDSKALPHHLLGHVYEDQSRWSEAESAFLRAVTLAPEDSGAWLHLGRVVERQHRATDAKELYRRGSFSAKDMNAALFADYLRVAIESGAPTQSLLADVEGFFQLKRRDSASLERIARALLARADAASAAERLAREALSFADQQPSVFLTLVEALIVLERWEDAMSVLPTVLFNSKSLDKHKQRIVNAFVELAARSDIAQLRELVSSGDRAALLAPLKAAFDLLLGEKPVVPQEVMLVAEDVQMRIRGRQQHPGANRLTAN